MIDAERCHGRAMTFADRPPAGTPVMDWWWSTYASSVELFSSDLGARWAMTTWAEDAPRMFLNHRLTAEQRNVAMAHEMHHLAVGGVCRGYCPRNEARVVPATTLWLLPDVGELAELLRRDRVSKVARELGVVTSEIWRRLELASPAERQQVDDIMACGRLWLRPQPLAAAS